MFPQATQIVDFFHAAEYVWEAAHARYGADSDLTAAWAQRLCRVLKAGRLDDVLEDLRASGPGRKVRLKAANYLDERRRRLRYDKYLAHGLPIGSGRVEAACKTVVKRRLKCTGRRWSVNGANDVLAVRCARLSGWFDDYWEDRLYSMAA